MENWKDIKDYEGLYQVSSFGNVRSLDRFVPHSRLYKQFVKGTLLRNSVRRGYHGVTLCKYGITKLISKHRLVASAFIFNPENKKQVNHINGIKTDNRVENLEWCTAQENVIHAVEIGLRKHKGSDCPTSKLTESDVISIRNNTKLTRKQLQEKFCVSKSAICSVLNRTNWNHL